MTDKELEDKLGSILFRIEQLEANYSIIKERTFGLEQDLIRMTKVDSKIANRELRNAAIEANQNMDLMDGIAQLE